MVQSDHDPAGVNELLVKISCITESFLFGGKLFNLLV